MFALKKVAKREFKLMLRNFDCVRKGGIFSHLNVEKC